MVNITSGNRALDFSDILIQPKLSWVNSRVDVNLITEYEDWSGIPIVSSNMHTVGTFEVAKVFSEFKMPTFLHKDYTLEDYKKNDYDPEYIGVSGGLNSFEYIKEILEYNPEIKFICLDVANGYISKFREFVSIVEDYFSRKNKIIVAGNVVTKEGVESLSNMGADVIKVGLGSGNFCDTRLKTGIGMPQFSAVVNCVPNAKWNSTYLMSDGGCRYPGDIAKAFAAGSNFVMIGGMLAGHDETSQVMYGMSSYYAMNLNGTFHDYRTSEGRVVKNIEYKGALKNTIRDILGGIRSACTYTNCASLSEFINSTHEIVEVNNQVSHTI